MNRISAIIIDDEFFNRKLIRLLIEKINPIFFVAGESENIRDGLKIINDIKPDVVFLDIKMPDGSGFDLLKQFGNINFEIVFITGFDQYALQAFDFNALDYVLKPIDADKFKLTLEKVRIRIQSKQNSFFNLKQLAESYNPKKAIITKIPIDYNNKVVLLDMDEILLIQFAEGNTVFTKFPSEQYTSPKHLSDFEFILDSFPNYIRINSRMYVNVNYIANYSKGFYNNITMKNGTTLEISAAKKTEIQNLFKRKGISQHEN